LTILRNDVWLSANEDADRANRILHFSGSVLAARSIGAVGIADLVADFVALPAGIYGGRSSFRTCPSSPVPARPITRLESVLNGFNSAGLRFL